jgi:histidyl-tRNA synthetase
VLVTVFDQNLWMQSYALAAELRSAGINVITYPEPVKLPRQFKFADRMGAKITLVLGPDEAAAGNVTLKNLADGTQQTLPRDQVQKAVRQILENHKQR